MPGSLNKNLCYAENVQHAAVGWVLDVSLSEQQTCAIFFLIMFIDTAVWWVLDVSLCWGYTE
jgi:hypothetical protein